MSKKAYSYIRFSTPEQIKGDSLRRQLEGSRQWAEENGYELDTSMRDLGVSAYSGANRTEGSLKKFIDLIEQGHIDEGSVLILESLDRLSREELTKSLNLFISILSAGIKIVTLADRQEYTAASINNIGNLVISLVSMARAHEESAMKSVRVRASLEARIANAHNKKVSGRCPNWLKYNKTNDEFEVIEERCELIREMFRKAIAGVGMNRISQELNESKTPVWGTAQGWENSYIRVILKSRMLLGEYQAHTHQSGKKVPVGEPVKGYYPAVISEEDFYAAQTGIAQRKVKRGRRGKHFTNLLQGISYCIKCHSKMRFLSRGKYSYLLCNNAFRKMGCDHHKYYPYNKIETLVLMGVAQKVDWYSLVSGVKTNLVELKRKQSSLSAQLTDAESRAGRYAGLFEVASGSAVELAQERYLSILNEQTEIKTELHAVENEISTQAMPDAAAIKSKMNHAIARLRTETDPNELFELRATINASLRDSVRLILGGHPNGEVAVSFSISGEPPEPLIYGNDSLKVISTVALFEEAKLVMDGLGGQIETYQCELDKAYDQMGSILGVKSLSGGTVNIEIPPIGKQQLFPTSRSTV